jgi:anti-anti-sigma factor
VDLHDGVLVYELAGDLDPAARDLLAFELSLHRTHAVIVDLEHVTFFGSTALNALIGLRNRASALGVAVHLAAPPHMAARVLQITGADTIFPIHDNRRDAMKAASAAPPTPRRCRSPPDQRRIPRSDHDRGASNGPRHVGE